MTPDLKARLVAAHRAQDWDLARQLSQAREAERREARTHRGCADCGRLTRGIRCHPCSILRRFYSRALAAHAALLLLLVLAGCAAPDLPKVNHYDEIDPLYAPAAAPQPQLRSRSAEDDAPGRWPTLTAVWNPSATPNVKYRLYHSTNLPPIWSLIAETTNTSAEFQSQERGFIGVKAVNSFGLESDWAAAAR